MVKRKNIRTRGKLSLSRYFQELKEGDRVAVVKERAVQAAFPIRMQGRTGVVEGKRGRTYIVKIKDHEKEKIYLIAPIHLKKMVEVPNKN